MITGAEVKTAVDLIALAHKQGWLERLLDAFKNKHRVLVLGASGTGKTNFIASLTEMLPVAIDRLNRTEYLKNNAIKIGTHPFVFVDTPGQERHSSKRMEGYRDAMREGIAGVINVVSFGYHEGPASLEAVFEADGSVKQGFLAARRAVELEGLSEWGTLLGSSDVTNWIMTVVTKADLWWSSRDTVFKYYESGDYENALRATNPMRSSVMGYCSVVHKFYGKGSVSSDFDDAERLRMHGHLIKELLAAIGH